MLSDTYCCLSPCYHVRTGGYSRLALSSSCLSVWGGVACHLLSHRHWFSPAQSAGSLTIPAAHYPCFLPLPQSLCFLLKFSDLFLGWRMVQTLPDGLPKFCHELEKIPLHKAEGRDVSPHLQPQPLSSPSSALLASATLLHSYSLPSLLEMDARLWLRSLLSKFLATVSDSPASLYPQHFKFFASPFYV